MSSSIEETSIPKLNDVEKQSRKQIPNLWNLPKVDKGWEKKRDELAQYQKMYTDLLYRIGKKTYGLVPDFDFTVEVTLPSGKFADVSYQVIAGPTVQLILNVCSTKDFEKLLHPILEKVRASVHSKVIEKSVELIKRQDEVKKDIPPFVLYEDLKGHKLEITREHVLTIYDPSTGITIKRVEPAESEPWRIMTHRAKMELIELTKLNKLMKGFEDSEGNDGTPNENENKVSIKSTNII